MALQHCMQVNKKIGEKFAKKVRDSESWISKYES